MVDVRDDGAQGPGGECLEEGPARMIRRLSYAGFVPVLVLTAWLVAIAPDHPWHGRTISFLAAYAALVLTFVAGARWGLAMAARQEMRARDPLVTLAPVLVGWAALLVHPPHGFVLLAIAFAALGAWDAFGVHAGVLPQWYGRLRVRMTLLMVAAMIAALVAMT